MCTPVGFDFRVWLMYLLYVWNHASSYSVIPCNGFISFSCSSRGIQKCLVDLTYTATVKYWTWLYACVSCWDKSLSWRSVKVLSLDEGFCIWFYMCERGIRFHYRYGPERHIALYPSVWVRGFFIDMILRLSAMYELRAVFYLQKYKLCHSQQSLYFLYIWFLAVRWWISWLRFQQNVFERYLL